MEKRIFLLISICCFLVSVVHAHQRPIGRAVQQQAQQCDSTCSGTSKALDVFQVHKTVTIPKDAEDIDVVTLIDDYSFGNSYGRPFVGNFTPSKSKFTNVHMNISVASKGRQFDRLAILYLGDVEVFRTSTAEPTPQGIIWTYTKDMTQYLSLWRHPQTVIFDLGNLINDIYTGPFNVTLTATFFKSQSVPTTADLILPISAKRGSENRPSAFSFPSERAATRQMFPKEASRAVVSIAACGQAEEEFWFSNVPTSVTNTFENTTGDLLGFSAYREVQLSIDGTLAGIFYPFPIVFTGGIAPGLWRPLVGIDAFDLREQEIDITAWLPYLKADSGKEHSFEIRVVGLQEKYRDSSTFGPIGNHWVITGKIFLFFGPSPPALPFAPTIQESTPTNYLHTDLIQSSDGQNQTLVAKIVVHRKLEIYSAAGYCSQNLYFENFNQLTNRGLSQLTRHGAYGDVQGVAISGDSSIPDVSWSYFFSFPITVLMDLVIAADGKGIRIDGQVYRNLVISCPEGRHDISLFTLNSGDVHLNAYQRGSAKYSSIVNDTYSFGRTLEEFEEQSGGQRAWSRNVLVINGTVVRHQDYVDVNMGGSEMSLRGEAVWGRHKADKWWLDDELSNGGDAKQLILRLTEDQGGSIGKEDRTPRWSNPPR